MLLAKIKAAIEAAIHVWEQGCVDRGYKDERNWIDETRDQLEEALVSLYELESVDVTELVARLRTEALWCRTNSKPHNRRRGELCTQAADRLTTAIAGLKQLQDANELLRLAVEECNVCHGGIPRTQAELAHEVSRLEAENKRLDANWRSEQKQRLESHDFVELYSASKAKAIEEENAILREALVRQDCGCLSLDCATHGAYIAEHVDFARWVLKNWKRTDDVKLKG